MNNPQKNPKIMVLGIGCTLLRDEGFGVQVVHELDRQYQFPAHVTLMDGGVLGVNLLGYIANSDHLIVVDAIRQRGAPGDLYRLTGDEVPQRIRAKNSVHQVDFLEALTLCQAIDKVPKTVIVGVEPEDIDTCSIELTPTLEARKADVIAMVLKELKALDVSYSPKKAC
ncbi:MAG: HyaD/HybD family hydrogenase maturation endopeptidase [Desulfobacterales bacterium]